MRYNFTAVFVESRDGKFILAYVEELPGAQSQGVTIEEAERHLREAIDLTIRANRQRIAAIFQGLRVAKRVEISVSKSPLRGRSRGEA